MNTRIAALLVVLSSPAVFADTLVLKNGAEISGMLVETKEKSSQNALIVIRVAGGEIAISESMIREKRKDSTTAESLQKSEEESRSKALAANQERRERMIQAAAAFDATKREGIEARPAGFSSLAETSNARVTGIAREKSVEEIGAEIEAKLELLRDFERRGLTNRTGFSETQRLRRAILDELFPNQKTQPIIW